MALLWVEGFENYNTSNVNINEYIDIKYVQRARNISLVSGRLGGFAASGDNVSTSILTPVLGLKNTWIIGMAYFETSLASSSLILFRRNSVLQGELSSIGTSGQLNLTSGSVNTNFNGKNSFIRPNKWNYLEMKISFVSSGSYEIRLNGKTIASASGVDLRSSGSDGANQILFTLGRQGYLDDIYICDNSGSVNNDFLGDTQVVGLLPNGDGFYSSWTQDSGPNHYSRVNELPITIDDTSYVESSTAGNIDTYTYTNISGTNFTDIAGLQINTVGRKTDLGMKTMSVVARSSGTDIIGDSVVLGDSYENHEQIFETDVTGSNWTITSVNASEFGMEVIS